MIRRAYVRGAITVGDSYGGSGSPPTLVGGSGMWFDGSDSTYAELETFEHPDLSYADLSSGILDQLPGLAQNAALATITARVRYQSLDTDMGPPQVYIFDPAAAPDEQLMLGAVDPPGPGSAAPAWVELPLEQQTDDGVARFLERIANSTTVQMRVLAPYLSTIAFRTPRTRIFEAHIVITTAGDYAPPCRNIKRGDRLDLGGARNYPPPKSQQGSSRGVGFY